MVGKKRILLPVAKTTVPAVTIRPTKSLRRFFVGLSDIYEMTQICFTFLYNGALQKNRFAW